jgi:hypothetical protein
MARQQHVVLATKRFPNNPERQSVGFADPGQDVATVSLYQLHPHQSWAGFNWYKR